jgi:leucyl aminopeptidase (aminopeptidase T)
MKRIITTLALMAFAAVPLATFAAQDESQRQVTQRLQEQKQQLAAIEKAQGAERDKLMQAHMKMMQETMGKMQAMKPREGMTPQEQKEWMAEHQKLMDQMMGQMMTEHMILMQGMPMQGMPRK